MDENKRKTGSGPLVLIGIVVVVLPLLYFLSLGPAVYLHEGGVLADEAGVVYEPLVWLAERSELFQRIGDSYTEWWHDLAHEYSAAPPASGVLPVTPVPPTPPVQSPLE